MLFVCENNLYAMGTALGLSESETDISAKASSYRMSSETVDGMNVVDVEVAARRAVDQVRDGNGPVFLECRTYRFRAHSMFDPELYREKQEVKEWTEIGPIRRFQSWALEAGELNQSDIDAIEGEVAEEISAAVAFAEAGTWEPVTELLRDVGAEARA